MADTKITALTATGSPDGDDLLYVVVDPSGTPASRKATVGDVVQAGAEAAYRLSRFITASFTYEDVAFALAETVPAGTAVGRCIVFVTTPWDGTATMTLGVAADGDKYAGSADIDLTTVGGYVVENFEYESTEQTIYAVLANGGSTQGEAYLFVELIRVENPVTGDIDVPTHLVFDGTGTYVACGSGATLDDLPDFAVAGKGKITIDGWIRADSYGTPGYASLMGKSGNVQFWISDGTYGTGLHAQVICATQTAAASSGLDEFTADGDWHHVLMCYDETGGDTPAARTIYLAVDGRWVVNYVGTQPSLGNYSGDASSTFILGYTAAFFDGAMGWFRVSDSIRYDPAGGNFTPPLRMVPPADDANTMALWKFDEGTGTAAADSSGNSNVGTIVSGTWGQG